MAWLEGLSTLKGQITSFTKEVLSEGRDEVHDTSPELTSSKKKVEELEALCASQDLEISELRQRNAELQRRLVAGERTTTNTIAATCEDVASKCVVQNQDKHFSTCEVTLHPRGETSDSSDELLDILKNAKQELEEKSQLLVSYKEQLENLQTEKQHVSIKCTHLEEQVQKLSKQLENESQKRTMSELSELEQLRSQLRTATGQLAQMRDENAGVLKDQLKVAELRIEELEKELQKVQQQMLDHLSDSQVNTSEIRGEVEQTRWQLLQESGVQKTELLRARQDMVNRIIQMGEKSREVEMNMKKLQLDGKHLTADIMAIIHKLGDPEQQELIHGALKALELENQVLKLRNAQLELAGNTETLKGNSYECSSKVDFHFGDDERKSIVGDNMDLNSKYLDPVSRKTDDDFETESLKSEVSELSLLKQKLDFQISQLQTKVEMYERDIECFEVMKSDWTVEKKFLEEHLLDLKDQLREKEEKLSFITAKKGLMEVKKQSPFSQIEKTEEHTALQKRIEELNAKLSDIQEEKDQLQQGKICLSSEVEAMAKIVQDLESQLAKAHEENKGLTNNLEELDEQHQDAIDQLLKVKQTLQKQNETLLSELTALKKSPDQEEHGSKGKSDSFEKTDTETQHSIAAYSHKEIQTLPSNEELVDDQMHSECRKHLEVEFSEKILKLITFEIPKDYFNFNNNNKDEDNPLNTIEALVKMCVECKWKKDTLERKVAELMKELRDTKHLYEESNKNAHGLENECRMLKGNVETLIEELMVSKSGGGEGLAPIPENSEEAEAMEQKIVMLENEIEVLREARSNLEADAKRLREEGQVLVRRLQTANATLRNQENLEMEARRWQEEATNTDGQLKEALAAKSALEEEIKSLHDELQKMKTVNQDQAYSNQSTEKELQQQIMQVQEKLLCQEELQDKMEAMVRTLQLTQEQLEHSEKANCKLKDDVRQLEIKFKSLSDQGHLQTENLQQQLQEACQAKEICLNSHVSFQEKITEELKAKSMQLEQASFKISEYEQSIQEAHEQLKNSNKDLESLSIKLNSKETQLNDELNSKSFMQNELIRIQELLSQEIKECSELKAEKLVIEQNLLQTVDTKLDMENKYKVLESVLCDKDVELDSLRKVKLVLEQEVERFHSAHAIVELQEAGMQLTTEEVERWKEMAEASERQLNEALQVRDELEQECRRLYRIETRVQNQEHLVRELERLKKLSEDMEQNSDQLLNEKLTLEQQCEDLRNQLYDLKEMERDSTERAANAEQQLRNVLIEKDELETKCHLLHTIEEKFKNLEKDFLKKNELSINLQQELNEVTSSKSELEVECKRLLAVEGKLRNQEDMELELKETKRKLSTMEEELNGALKLKLQFENEHRKMETAYKLLMAGQKEETGAVGSFSEQITLNSRDELEAMEEQIQSIKDERQSILSVLNEKTRENGMLKAENGRLLQVISELKSSATKLEEERQFHDNEATQMAKETVSNLSEIIKDKDMEIEALKQKSETLVSLLQDSSSKIEKPTDDKNMLDELGRLNSERTELIRTVQVKHQESVQYHNEIQRLTVLLNQEVKKFEEIKQQHMNMAQYYDDQQKLMINMQNELSIAKVRIHQLETGQVHLAAQNIDISNLESGSTQKTSEIGQSCAHEQQGRENEVDVLRTQVSAFQNQLMTMSQSLTEKSNIESVIAAMPVEMNSDSSLSEDVWIQLETLQTECTRMSDNLLQEQTRNKYLQNEVQEQYEKESVLLKELERLRLHLMTVEESYTLEALKAEEQVKDLQSKLTQAEERIKNSSTAYTSASIRANQHVESLQGQARLITQQRDDIQQKLSAAEDQVQHHSAALRNLQIVLEQFQRDKDREISSATERMQQQLQVAQLRHDDFYTEIGILKVQLSEAKEGLSAAARLGEQLDKKSESIAALKEEVAKLSSQLQESENRVQSASLNVEGKVDRYLVKNLVLGYFMAPSNTRSQVLHIVATVLDFNQDERNRVGLESETSSSGWFKSLLQPGKGPANMQSLSEAFVRFLENESRPQPQLRLLPQVQEGAQGDNRSDSPTSSTSGSQRRSPLLLSEVHLPTFTQFPVGRNSSSILKDVLKDS